MSRRNYLGEVAALLVREVWQRRVGPRYNAGTGTLCRFHPSCSEYAAAALSKYGLLRGARLAVNRLRRCNPANLDSCIDYP